MKFGTKAVQSGNGPDPATGAVMTPIYQTSTYHQASPGQHKGYEYSRSGNPTRASLETALAQLEDARFGLAFSSGMGAEDAIIKLLKPGDEVICTNDLYGGSYRMFVHIFQPLGIRFRFVDMGSTEQVAAALTPATRMLWIETPTNPLIKIIDIAALTQLVKGKGILTVVDNTFATPYLQSPLKLGADIVVHSATKYLAGHSDVVLGAIMLDDEELRNRLFFIQKSCGAVPGPMDSFLTLRGIKTLHVRMERHCQNAAAVAQYLAGHPKVAVVNWPGLSEHPGHAVARKQMRAFGGMLSFSLKGDSQADAFKLMEKLRIFTLAESLGGVESLIGHPATMTHASIPEAERLKAGLSNSLIRISAGIEDAEDLLADLEQALAAV
ncbi:MAG: cystathionine gamma-synthase [Bacteroidetes bacterium]|nr:cystathionine gamma-synthase [Bacteroidota bacterium]